MYTGLLENLPSCGFQCPMLASLLALLSSRADMLHNTERPATSIVSFLLLSICTHLTSPASAFSGLSLLYLQETHAF